MVLKTEQPESELHWGSGSSCYWGALGTHEPSITGFPLVLSTLAGEHLKLGFSRGTAQSPSSLKEYPQQAHCNRCRFVTTDVERGLCSSCKSGELQTKAGFKVLSWHVADVCLTLKYCTRELDTAWSLTREVVTVAKMHLHARWGHVCITLWLWQSTDTLQWLDCSCRWDQIVP